VPLVAHTALPAFSRLREEGFDVVLPNDLIDQPVERELHLGLLNLMHDAALEATERQFLRLLVARRPSVRIVVHPFTLEAMPRGAAAREHISRHYLSFAEVRERGLDALIVTGTNVTGQDLSREPFWAPLLEVAGWAGDNVASTLLSCLATHAVLHGQYGQPRVRLPAKRWGVYPHQVTDPAHPLVAGLAASVDVPHSRWNEVFPAQFAAAGLRVLLAGQEAGVHLAVSPDGARLVFLQGHPEYDAVSLLKEFKREALLWAAGASAAFPPVPDHYLSAAAQAIVERWGVEMEHSVAAGAAPPDFPEAEVVPLLAQRWRPAAEIVVGNWVQGLDRSSPV
jgi:homoserine O-succinyltransferase